MRFVSLILCIYLLMTLMGCGLLKENGTYELDNGRYKQSVAGKTQKIWVSFEDSIIRLSPLDKKSSQQVFPFNNVSGLATSSLKLKKIFFRY